MICANHPEHGLLPDEPRATEKRHRWHCPSQCPEHIGEAEAADRIRTLEATVAKLVAFIAGMPDAPVLP